MSQMATHLSAAAGHTGLSQTFVKTRKQLAKSTVDSGRYGS